MNETIFQKVINAMEEAEGMGGPEGPEYVQLMTSIAMEAISRIRNFSSWHEHGHTSMVADVVKILKRELPFATVSHEFQDVVLIQFPYGKYPVASAVFGTTNVNWGGNVFYNEEKMNDGYSPDELIATNVSSKSANAAEIAAEIIRSMAAMKLITMFSQWRQA